MKKGPYFNGILFSLVLLVVTAGMAFGETWYVAPDGANTPMNGTSSDPFKTIQYAVDQASNGDTILVEEGTYFEEVNIHKDQLTLRSLTPNSATIHGEDYCIQLLGNGLTLEDLNLQNAGKGIVVSGDQTEDLNFSSNWIESMLNYGIYFYWDAAIEGSDVLIEDNLVLVTGVAILMEGDMGLAQDVDIQILDNYISDASTGIEFWYLHGGSVEISDNTIIDCNSSGIYVDEIDPDGAGVSFRIENNDISLASGMSGSHGVYMNNAERSTWIKDNTITGQYQYGIYIPYLGFLGAEPLQTFIEGNQVTGCSIEGISLWYLFINLDGSIYIRENTISDSNNGIYLHYLGDGTAGEGFELYIEENVVFDCDAPGLEFDYLFYNAPGSVYLRRNNFIDNQYGIFFNDEYHLEESSLVVENNNFEGNKSYGIFNDMDVLISAPDNWWGDPSGPYDPTTAGDNPSYDNPEGLGDEVSEYVDYEPWRESPYIAGEESTGGCSTGGFDPALILLIVPMLGLFIRKKR